MKIKILSALLGILVLAPGLWAAGGTLKVGTTNYNYGPYQTGSGGEFTLQVLTGIGIDLSRYVSTTSGLDTTSNSFQTFCLESNESLVGHETDNYVINTGAIGGGVGVGTSGTVGTPGFDPISKGTAWLYSKFINGTLSGYSYGTGRTTTAAQLQNAIWALENEIAWDSSNPFIQLVMGVNGLNTNQAGLQADSNGAYGIAAVNLTNGTTRRQDQLVATTVPDGGSTIMLLGMAAGILGLVSRRRQVQNLG